MNARVFSQSVKDQTQEIATRSKYEMRCIPDTSISLLRAHTRNIPKLPQRKKMPSRHCKSSSCCNENRSVTLDPAVTIHVASAHAGEIMVLIKDSRWQSPTSIETYASTLSLWLCGTKDMLVHTLLHACVHTLENIRLAIACCSKKVKASGGHER
jgi:hypothetical protein